MSIHNDCLSIAGDLRTPDEVTARIFSRPASVGRRLLLLLCCIAVLHGCAEDEPTDADPSVERVETVETAEAWSVPMIDAAGLTELRQHTAEEGKVLVVDCWATWCGSCVLMFPHLHQAIKERGEGVVLVSLSFDEGGDLPEKAASFLEKQKATENAYRAAEGSDAKDAVADALSDSWDGGVLPAVFVYAPDGGVALEFTETRGDVEDWVAEIAAAVDASLPNAESSPGQ
jgi:thiol-disulfide isomerase/thioredoxin